MDSADAAPPPKAPPLPEATTANTVTSPIVATSAPQEPSATTTSSSASTASVPISPTTIPSNSKASTTATITKKRPLPGATTHAGETLSGLTTTRLVPPTLKAKYDAKAAPTKAKKSLKKKTKKKKFSSILSGMMKPKKEVDIQAERESLRKNLGGGNFAKIDKI